MLIQGMSHLQRLLYMFLPFTGADLHVSTYNFKYSDE